MRQKMFRRKGLEQSQALWFCLWLGRQVYRKGSVVCPYFVSELQKIFRSIAEGLWQFWNEEGRRAVAACFIHVPVSYLTGLLLFCRRIFQIHLSLLRAEKLTRYGNWLPWYLMGKVKQIYTGSFNR